jgi:PKD repeat protein
MCGQTFSSALVHAQINGWKNSINKESNISYENPESQIETQLLRFTYDLTRKRTKPIKLIPLPGIFFRESAYIGRARVKANVLALFFPAKSNIREDTVIKKLSQKIETIKQVLTEKYASLATPSYVSDSSVSDADVAATILNAMYDSRLEFLADLGVKPAFMPYDNLSFYVIIIVWITPQDDITKFLLSKLTETFIPYTFVISSFIEALNSGLADKTADYILLEINNIITTEKEKIMNSLTPSGLKKLAESKIICNCIDENRSEAKTSLNCYDVGLAGSLINAIKLHEDEITKNAYEYAKKVFLSWLRDHYQEGISKEQEDAANILISAMVNSQSRAAFNAIYSWNGFNSNLYEAKSLGENCSIAIKNLKALLDGQSIYDTVRQRIENTISTLSTNIRNALQGVVFLQKALGIGADISTKAFTETLSSAASQLALAAGPAWFTAYVIANAVLTAAQRTITKVSLNFSPSNETLILGLENVRFTDKDVVTVSKSPPLSTNFDSAIRGLFEGGASTFAGILGPLGSIFLKTTAKVLLTAPTEFAIYVDLKDLNKNVRAVKAPPYPGIYYLGCSMSFETGADYFSDFINTVSESIKQFFTVTIPSKVNNQKADQNLLNAINSIIITAESKAKEGINESQQQSQEGFTFIIPYFVLTPHFIVDSIDISKQSNDIKLNMYAVYDLSPLFIAKEFLWKSLSEMQDISQFDKDIIKDKLMTFLGILVEGVLDNFIGDKPIFSKESIASYSMSWEVKTEYAALSFVSPTSGVVVIESFKVTEERIIEVSIKNIIKFSLENSAIEFSKKLFSEFIGTLSEPVLDFLINRFDITSSYLTPLLTIKNNLICPVLNSEDSNIAPYFRKISALGGTIDSNGFVSVSLRFIDILKVFNEREYATSLETVPVFVRKTPGDNRPTFFTVPGSGISLEPVIVPLIPVVRIVQGVLYVKFTTPFLANTPSEYSGISMIAYILADGKPHRIDWDSEHGSKAGLLIGMDEIADSAIATLQIDEVHIKRGCLGVAILVPTTAEVPIYVNPGKILVTARASRSAASLTSSTKPLTSSTKPLTSSTKPPTSEPLTVTVQALPAPPSLTISNRVSVTWNGLTVTINGEAAPGYSGASISRIHWDWGDGSSEDHWFPATHTYSNYGTYIITATVYQSDGLTSTKIIQLVLSRSVASSALSSFLGQIKIKASIIKNQTDNTYSFTLQIIPLIRNIPNVDNGPLNVWLILDDSDIKTLTHNIYNQLIQQGLLSTEDSSNVKGLVVVAPDDVIDENAVGLLNQLFSLPSTARNIIEAWDYIGNFGVDGIVLSSAKFAYLYGLNNFKPPPPTTIAGRVFNTMYTSLSEDIEKCIFKGGCDGGYAPIYVHTENGYRVLRYSQTENLFIVGPGQELEVVVKGLKQPSQAPLELQISGRNAILLESYAGNGMPKFTPPEWSGTTGYEAFPSGFSTSITLICGGGGWLGFLGGSTTNCYSDGIIINEHYTLNGVPPTVEVNVYSPEDIIKNVVLEPSAQSIKQGDPLDVSVSFDLDPSFIFSLRNLGPESASVQEKPMVTVELYEEKAIHTMLGSWDRKISEKSLELQSTGSTLNERVVFKLHGSDLGWLIWHDGNHKLHARITLKYCESEATWITQARWGTIVVETPRITVSVKS